MILPKKEPAPFELVQHGAGSREELVVQARAAPAEQRVAKLVRDHLPEIIRHQLSIPFYFGGTSVLIVVSVVMDTINQVQSHLLAHQYEGLIKRSKLRGRRK